MSDPICTRCRQRPSTGILIAMCDECFAAFEAELAVAGTQDDEKALDALGREAGQAQEAQYNHEGFAVVRDLTGRALGITEMPSSPDQDA